MTDNEVRLQAEIKRLESNNKITQHLLSEAWKGIEEKDKLYKTIKSEVIKEFADSLKQEKFRLFKHDEGGWGLPVFVVNVDDIDNLVKKMVGEDNG